MVPNTSSKKRAERKKIQAGQKQDGSETERDEARRSKMEQERARRSETEQDWVRQSETERDKSETKTRRKRDVSVIFLGYIGIMPCTQLRQVRNSRQISMQSRQEKKPKEKLKTVITTIVSKMIVINS